MERLDDLHYSFRKIDGYNKPFNFVISARECGKTTSAWVTKVYSSWRRTRKPFIYLTRTAVEINEALIDSIFDTTIRKFADDKLEVSYNKGAFKDGIVDVFVNGEIFFRIVSLSIPLRRIKLAVLKNIGGVLMDEYIIDPKTGEKYIKEEAFKIKEAYTTWRRESDGVLKCYFLGNPYSTFNPLFVAWGVDTRKLKRGEIYVGDSFVIEWATLHPLLREKLLRDNPLYEFDEDYKGYALDGVPKNDAKIRLGAKPDGFRLRFVFRIAGKILGVFWNSKVGEDPRYFVSEIEEYGRDRTAFAFDFDELLERTALVGLEERFALARFKDAFRERSVVFESVVVYYFIEEIYTKL